MLFHMKDQKAAVLENDLNKLQKDGPAAWAELPEDELFTPAGFRAEQAEATAYSNYSYWGSTFRPFSRIKWPWPFSSRWWPWWLSPFCSPTCPVRWTRTCAKWTP